MKELINKLAEEQNIAELIRISNTSPRKDIQKYAKRILHKLKTKGIKVERVIPSDDLKINSYLTKFYAQKERAIIIMKELPFGKINVAILELNFRCGITKCRWVEFLSKIEWYEIMTKMEKDYPLIEFPIEYAKYLINEAYNISLKEGKKVAKEFYYYIKPLLNEIPHKITHPIIYEKIREEELPATQYYFIINKRVIDEYLTELHILLLEYEDIKAELDELAEIDNSKIVLPEWITREKKAKIVNKIIEKVFTEDKVREYIRVLEEIAYFTFYQHGLFEVAKFLTTCAVSLRNESNLKEHPFILEIVNRSIKEYRSEEYDEEEYDELEED